MYLHYFEDLEYTSPVYLYEGDIDWTTPNPYIFPVEDVIAPNYDSETEYLVDLMPTRREDGTWVRRLEVRQFAPLEIQNRKALVEQLKLLRPQRR